MLTDFQPYVGPRPYERDDQVRFFGRDHEAHELLSLIISSRELLFYAQSGTGKTSLLNAGVIPLLEQKPFEVLPVARVQGVLPPRLNAAKIQNVYIFNALMQWLKGGADSGKLTHTSLAEFLKQRKRPTDRYGKPYPRAIIFDQFEEFFILYSARWKDRRGFFEQVCDALEDDRRLRVIFTIREDYIAQLDPYAHLLPENLRTRFRIERLRRDAALSAITEPLRETERSFAKGVANKLVEDLLKTQVETIAGETIEVIGEFVEPVQLQVVCQNLWHELPSDVTEITEKHLLAFGGVDRPLSRFYEAAVKAAAEQTGIDEEKLRQWCEKWLITSTGTRNIVHRGPQQTEGIPNTALDILADRHLINLEWRAGARWYELTHDRFIDPIRASNKKQREEKAIQASLLIRQAEQSITMQKYERALDTSKKAYAVSEEMGDLQGEAIALFYHGKAYEGQKQYEEAIRTYARALEIVKQTDTRDVEANLLESQGSLSVQMKEYKQAVQCFNAYIELIPDDPGGYYNLGLAHRNLKMYEQAIKDYNHALELDSKFVYAYNGRGNAYSDLKQFERAIEDYNRALELDPKYVDAYNNRGNAYSDLKQYERAIEDYNQALVLDPKYVKAYNNRGLAYSDLKQYEQAIEDYNKALVLDPKYVDAYFNRGLAYYALKQYERAIEDFNRSLELDPEKSEAYLMRGYSSLWLSDINQAQKNFMRSGQLDSTNVNYGLMTEWANICQWKPGLETAERLEAIASNEPDNDEAYVCRGVALWIRAKYEEAAAELHRAIQLYPELEDIYFWKGMVHAYLGQDVEAKAAIDKSLELGLPPVLLSPLRWIEQDRPGFYQKYAASLLARLDD